MNMDPGTERSLRDMPAQIARMNRSINELTDCVKNMQDALTLIATVQAIKCDLSLERMKENASFGRMKELTELQNTIFVMSDDLELEYKDRHAPIKTEE